MLHVKKCCSVSVVKLHQNFKVLVYLYTDVDTWYEHFVVSGKLNIKLNSGENATWSSTELFLHR